MERQEVSQQQSYPVTLDGLVFFARRSSGGKLILAPLEACTAHMRRHWTAQFGKFDGACIELCGTQCARLRLRANFRIAFTEFVATLQPQSPDGRPRVELVVSGPAGFLTDIRFFCAFFELMSTVEWRFTFFDNNSEEFTSVNIYAIIEHFYGRPTTLDEDTQDFVEKIKRANDARHSLAGPDPITGPRGRNRTSVPDRPDLNGRERQRTKARRVQVQQCPACPRHFLTVEEFRAHEFIHGPETLTPIVRNLDHDVGNKPMRFVLHTFESTLIRAWRCKGCGLETSSSGTVEGHPPKCRNNPERNTGLDLFTTWVTDADNMKVGYVECQFCFSSIATERLARAHVRQEHHHDADGHYLCHKEGFKVVCPEPGCGWTFKKLYSLAVHCHNWHGWQPGSEEFISYEYRAFPPGTPNDPLVMGPPVTKQEEVHLESDALSPEALTPPNNLLAHPATLPEIHESLGTPNDPPPVAQPGTVPMEVPETPEALLSPPNDRAVTPRPSIMFTICPRAPKKEAPSRQSELYLRPGKVYPTAVDLYDYDAYL